MPTVGSKPLDPAEKALQTKRQLVKRLEREVIDVRRRAEAEVEKLQGRIVLAKALVTVLEKGISKK